MLTLRGNVIQTAASLDRRSFLTLGALPPLGLALPQLLAAGQSAETARSNVSIILFFMAGGHSENVALA